MYTPKFWAIVKDRALRTAAQAAIIALGFNASEYRDELPVLDAFAADWVRVGSAAVGGAILAVLFSIVWPPKEAQS